MKKICVIVVLSVIWVLFAGSRIVNANEIKDIKEIKQKAKLDYDESKRMSSDVKKVIMEGQLKDAGELIKKYEEVFEGEWKADGYAFYARMDLGQEYCNFGEFDKAIEIYEQAQPGGGCGNCMDGQMVWRNDHIAKAYEYKLAYFSSLKIYLDTLSYTKYGGGNKIVWNGILRSLSVCMFPITILLSILSVLFLSTKSITFFTKLIKMKIKDK